MKLSFRLQLLLLAGLSWVLAVLFWLASIWLTPLSQVENWFLDLRVSLMAPAGDSSENIVIVGITEETLSTLTYRQPIDRAFLASIIQRIDRARPMAIGLDVLLDQPTEPLKDQLLKNTIQQIDSPFFAAYASTSDSLDSRQFDFLNNFVPVGKRALVNLRRDSADGVVRSVLAVGENNVPGLPNAMANADHQIGVLALQRNANEEAGAFPVYPAHIINTLPDSWFTGKWVLLGAVLPLQDRYPSSFQALMGLQDGARPGIEIHAHALSNLLKQNDYQRMGFEYQLPAMFTLVFLGLLIGRSDWKSWQKLFFIVFFTCTFWAFGAAAMRHLHLAPLVITPLLCMLVASSIGVVIAGRQHRAQKLFIRHAMSHYVAPEIVSDLQRHPEKLALGGQRRVLSIVFTDIAGFTELSEQVEAGFLLNQLNTYLHGMSEIINRHQGIVDKYIGDSVVGLFNAPLDVEQHALCAVNCAIEMDLFAQQFKLALNRQGIHWGETRIGVHTGEVIVGNMGGQKRFDYTAIGSAMNTAARLEGLNKYLPTRVCVSDETVRYCGSVLPQSAVFCSVAEVLLKGKEIPLHVYTPLLAKDAQQQEAIAQYNANMAMLKQVGADLQDLQVRLKNIQTDHADLAALLLFQQQRFSGGVLGKTIVLQDK